MSPPATLGIQKSPSQWGKQKKEVKEMARKDSEEIEEQILKDLEKFGLKTERWSVDGLLIIDCEDCDLFWRAVPLAEVAFADIYNVKYVGSDGRFSSPRVDFYVHADFPEDYIYYSGDSDSIETLERFMGLVARHSDRFLHESGAGSEMLRREVLGKYASEEDSEDREGDRLLVVTDGLEYSNDVVNVVWESDLDEITSTRWRTGDATIYFHTKTSQFYRLEHSHWQGSADYTLTTISLEELEDIPDPCVHIERAIEVAKVLEV